MNPAYGKWNMDDAPAPARVHHGAWEVVDDPRSSIKDVKAGWDYKAPWEYDGPAAGPVTVSRVQNFDHGSKRR